MRSYTQGCLPTGKVVVDDTGAFIAGLPLILPLKHLTTPLVINEVKDKESRRILQRSTELGRVEVLEPSRRYIDKAKALAKSAGTLSKLSPTDISVIALALEVSELKGCEVLVATDDYAVQHTLLKSGIKVIKIRYRGVKF